MVLVIAFILSLASTPGDLISNAIDNFEQINSYQVTLRSSGSGSSEEIKYYYKKPGHTRMEFIRPHKGAALVYNPYTRKVRLRPIGFLKFLVLTLDPDSRLLKSSRGHRVDRSDIGSLLKTVKRLESEGTGQVSGNDNVGQRQAVLVSVKGREGFSINGINSYNVWFDSKSLLPLRVSAYNSQGEPVEDVLMDDLQINVEFPDNFFEL